jgi:cytochrome c peroxidase
MGKISWEHHLLFEQHADTSRRAGSLLRHLNREASQRFKIKAWQKKMWGDLFTRANSDYAHHRESFAKSVVTRPVERPRQSLNMAAMHPYFVRRRNKASLLAFLMLVCSGCGAARQIDAPDSVMQVETPQDSPQTLETIALGRVLFFDRRLSADGTVSCSTCHDPDRAFTDGKPVSVGIKGRKGQRNSPTILNALYNKSQFWDGRVKTLEEQAALPIVNAVEMGQSSLDAAVATIGGFADYRRAFRQAFGGSPNGADLQRAIASYERTLVALDSPFDKFIAGDQNAIPTSARRGWEIFNTRGGCNKCHAVSEKKRDTTNFTDNDFHNIGIGIVRHNVVALARQAEKSINSGDTAAMDSAAIQSEMSALGRFLVSKKITDIASFKTPNLRNVLVTAPYFHDGSQATLWDVVDHYNKGDGRQDPYLDEDIAPLALSEVDIDDLVEFLASLTSSSYRALGTKELARQRALSQISRPQRDTAKAFGPNPRANPRSP